MTTLGDIVAPIKILFIIVFGIFFHFLSIIARIACMQVIGVFVLLPIIMAVVLCVYWAMMFIGTIMSSLGDMF